MSINKGKSTKGVIASERRKRATAVIISNSKILLIKRIKPNQEYFIFPGVVLMAERVLAMLL